MGQDRFRRQVELTNTPDLIADVAVDPNAEYALSWPTGASPTAPGPETGGQNSPDAGA